MCTILAFVILCSSLYGQVAPVVSNSPNSPYRQLSLLTKDVDRLKEIILVDWANKKAKIGSDEIAQRAKLHYAASIMANQYCNIYEALVRR